MSEPLFPEPEPGQHPANRSVPAGQHPWAPSVLTEYEQEHKTNEDQDPHAE